MNLNAGSGARASQRVVAGLARFPFFIQHRERVTEIGDHTQPGVEINIAHEGCGRLIVNGECYVKTPKQVAVFRGESKHRFISEGPSTYQRTVICIDPSRLPLGRPVLESIIAPNVLSWQMDERTYRDVDRMCRYLDKEMREQQADWESVSSSILLHILVLLKRSLGELGSAAPCPAGEERHADVVEACCEYIRHHLGEPISLSSLASRFHVSRGHLARKFRQELGVTVHEYIMDERMTEAKRLIATQREMSITEIALRLGFLSLSHFSRTFRSRVGLSPALYRRHVGYA